MKNFLSIASTALTVARSIGIMTLAGCALWRESLGQDTKAILDLAWVCVFMLANMKESWIHKEGTK